MLCCVSLVDLALKSCMSYSRASAFSMRNECIQLNAATQFKQEPHSSHCSPPTSCCCLFLAAPCRMHTRTNGFTTLSPSITCMHTQAPLPDRGHPNSCSSGPPPTPPFPARLLRHAQQHNTFTHPSMPSPMASLLDLQVCWWLVVY